MKILIDNVFNKEIDTDKFAAQYDAKFVCETCIRGVNGWINQASLIFYTEKAHPEGSNYMALTEDPIRGWLISDGISVTEKPMTGIVTDNGVMWSKYRHDFVGTEEGAVDGGRDYTKINGDPKTVSLEIVDGVVRVV